MEAASVPSRGRVLLADDDDAFRRALAACLARAGFECEQADSAAAALDQLKKGGYEALISDIEMPGNADLELVETLPSVAGGLPVILLTGRPSVETAARSVRLHAAAYLLKPPDFAELCAVLEAAIGDFRGIRLLKENRKRLQDWDQEIERMIRLLEHGAGQTPRDRQAVQQDYMRLTLRNLVVGLIELENLMLPDPEASGVTGALEKQSFLNTLRKTIGVLSETRHQFKSKALGELRKELETLISTHTP